MKIALSIQPESNKRLLKRSLRLYRASIPHVFGLALLLSLIVFIPRIISLVIEQDILDSINTLFLYNFFLIALNIGIIFVFTAILWRMRCIIMDAHESILDDFTIASKKIFLIIAAAIIQMLIIGMITFIVYYFFTFIIKQNTLLHMYIAMAVAVLYFFMWGYVFYLLIFYLPLILTEDKGFISSLLKSVSLVWGNWWRVFLLQITPLISYVLFLLLIKYLFKIDLNIYFISYMQEGSILTTLINLLIFAFFIPFNAAVLLIQLRDLELRKQVSLS